MLHPITTKLEIDVLQASELPDAVDLAVTHNCPAIVVHQQLMVDALMARGKRRGKFKIITPVDWPRGDTYGTVKMRGLTIDTLDTDGQEIMLTPGRTTAETTAEAVALTQFVRQHISHDAEIRFVVEATQKTEKELEALLAGLVGIPTPAYIRTDHALKAQVGKANVEAHNRTVDAIRAAIGSPVKVSGNVNSVRVMTSCPNAARFAVSLSQARQIVQEVEQQPDEIKQLLTPTT